MHVGTWHISKPKSTIMETFVVLERISGSEGPLPYIAWKQNKILTNYKEWLSYIFINYHLFK